MKAYELVKSIGKKRKNHFNKASGVKAQAIAEGIKVSWNVVPGASYYRVYRTIDPEYSYDADLKTYDYDNSCQVEPTGYVQADEDTHSYYTLGACSAKMREIYWEDQKKLFYHYPNNSDDYVYGGIAGTSVIDYSYSYHNEELNQDGTVKKDNVTFGGPLAGVTYYYYVVAYRVARNTEVTSHVSYHTVSSYGAGKAASAVFAGGMSE